MSTAGSASFPTTVWMIYRIHRHAAYGGSYPSPTISASFTQLAQIVLPMPYFADRCAAIHMNLSHFTGTHTQSCVGSFPGSELGGSACSANQLSAFPWLQFNAVHQGPNRDISNRQGVACLYRRIFSRQHGVSRTETFGRENVATLTVCIQNQRKMCAAIWIIFNMFHATGNAVLVSLEIDLPIASFVSATAMARCDSTLVIAPTTLG